MPVNSINRDSSKGDSMKSEPLKDSSSSADATTLTLNNLHYKRLVCSPTDKYMSPCSAKISAVTGKKHSYGSIGKKLDFSQSFFKEKMKETDPEKCKMSQGKGTAPFQENLENMH